MASVDVSASRVPTTSPRRVASTRVATSGTAYPLRAASSSEADRLVVRAHCSWMAAPMSAIGAGSPSPHSTRSTAQRASSPLGVRPCPAPISSRVRRRTSASSPQRAARHTSVAWSISPGACTWRDRMSASSASRAVLAVLGTARTRDGRHSRTHRIRQLGSRMPDRPMVTVSPGSTPQSRSWPAADSLTPVGSRRASEARTGRTSWWAPADR